MAFEDLLEENFKNDFTNSKKRNIKYIKNKLKEMILMMQKLLNQTKQELNNLQSGDTFLLKDLFEGYEWNRIERSNKIELGKLFLEYVNSRSDVKSLGKTTSNHCKYEKL